MKLNNRGFAISSILYIILIMAVILVSLTLTILTSRKLIIEKTKEETLNKIYNRYELTYREVLKQLKEEIISYATENNITKESIKIGDFSTSISEEIINGYKLDTKYLTVVSKNSNYDVYLGKKETIIGNNKEVKDLVDIIDYKIEGNSYQETYTGKNLFDKDKWVNGTETVFNGVDCLLIKDNDSYSYTIPGDSSTQYMFTYKIYRDEENESKITNLKIADRKTVANISHNTLHSVAVYGGETIQFGGWNINLYLDLSVTQIEKGSTATSYEPYVGGKSSPNPDYPQKVYSVGNKITDDTNSNYGKYNIPIKTGGKNLLDKNESRLNGVKNETPTLGWATGVFDNEWIVNNMKADTTYTLSYDIECIDIPEYDTAFSANLGLYIYSEVSGYNAPYSLKQKYLTEGEKVHFTHTFTTPSNFLDEEANYKIALYTNRYLKDGKGVLSEMVISNIQLELGNEETNYMSYVEPQTTNIYLDNPLRKVDTKIDSMSFSNNNIKRNVGFYNFDSNIAVSYVNAGATSNNLYRSYVSFKNLKDYMVLGSNIFGYSNVLPANKQRWNKWTEEQVHFGQNNIEIYLILDEEKATLDDVYDYLSSDGTVEPYFIYQLNSEKTEEVSLPKINTSIGTQTISVDTDIEPSNVEFTVIKKIKQL